MKKIISMLLVTAMLALTAAALADTGSDQIMPSGQPLFGQQQPFSSQPPSGDPPEKPDGEMPSSEQPSGQAPNGQPPSGDPPEKPDGQAPSGEQPFGQGPFGQGPAGNGPVMVDFDALAQAGVISQDTCDRIKAYMEANKPADPPADDGRTPSGEQPGDLPEQPDGKAPSGDRPADPPADGDAPAEGGLLKDLLDAGVITQEEYDAINAARQAVSET